MAEPSHWTVAAARGRALTDGVAAVVEEHLERSARAAVPEAWISRPSPDKLRARAATVEARLAGGADLPLAGVPFAVKDNIDVVGAATTVGCTAFAYRPASTARAVARLLDAGALFVGKTNLDQFATGLVGTRSPQYGGCRNPIVPEYIAGGSSSGSAIAVATGQVPFALGTDTAGSGRVPAASCGIVGLKPTPGIVPTTGVFPAMRSIDCVTTFTTDTTDAALVLEVLTAASPANDRVPRRLGIPAAIDWHGDDDARARFTEATDRMRELGASVEEVEGNDLWAAGSMLYGSALVAERHAAFGEFAATHADAVDPAVATIVAAAGDYSGSEVFRALAELEELATRAAPLWDAIDALVLPTVARVPTFAEAMADPFGPSRELGALTAFVNPLGLAALAVPAGVRASGVPFGVSFVGPAGSDQRLLALGAAFSGAGSLTGPELTGPALTGPELTGRPCRLAVVGAHLEGQPLHHQLTDLGAVLCARTATAPEYRLFALETTPPKPGLVRAPGAGGAAIAVEVYALDPAGLGAFVAAIPSPLGVGRVALADGTEVTGFLCEPHAIEGAREITAFGGWRAYLLEVATPDGR